jgi:hypothetical protein
LDGRLGPFDRNASARSNSTTFGSLYDRLYHHNDNRKNGAVLAPHPDKPNGRVLHVRRPLDPKVFSQRDGAVWNFPAGTNGTLTTRFMLNPEFGGGMIALQDRWYQPTDSQGEETAMCRVDLPSDGKLTPTITLEKGRWYRFDLQWRVNSRTCHVTIDGQQQLEIAFANGSVNGISYVRFRSTALRPDPNGLYVEYVRARIERGIQRFGFNGKDFEDNTTSIARIPDVR